MKERFDIFPVGVIKKQGETVWIEIYDKYNEALIGLDGFSHL